jgi:lipopolysaccharide transport system ATP-binding protein
VEKFLDTPVKRYSSGMYVRLAFAVAAHLEPEILIVDEVLAVGDAEFQKKCLGKMQDVAAGGRTVLFVSHNLGAVSSLCTRGMVMKAGRLELSGPVELCIATYESLVRSPSESIEGGFHGPLNGIVCVRNVTINDKSAKTTFVTVGPDDSIRLAVRYTLQQPERLRIAFVICQRGVRIFTEFDSDRFLQSPAGEFESTIEIRGGLLRPGQYTVGIGASRDSTLGDWVWNPEAADFEVRSEWSNDLDRDRLGICNFSQLVVQGRHQIDLAEQAEVVSDNVSRIGNTVAQP